MYLHKAGLPGVSHKLSILMPRFYFKCWLLYGCRYKFLFAVTFVYLELKYFFNFLKTLGGVTAALAPLLATLLCWVPTIPIHRRRTVRTKSS